MKFFGFFWTLIFLLVALWVFIISIAPHNDMRMRGFSPCTYEMGAKLSSPEFNRSLRSALDVVIESHFCYFEVVKVGFMDWLEGKQEKPWDNYFFEPDVWVVPDGLSEPFSDDLLKANKLNTEGEVFNFDFNGG